MRSLAVVLLIAAVLSEGCAAKSAPRDSRRKDPKGLPAGTCKSAHGLFFEAGSVPVFKAKSRGLSFCEEVGAAALAPRSVHRLRSVRSVPTRARLRRWMRR